MTSDPDRRRTSIHLRAQPTPAIPGYHVLERLGTGRNGTVFRAIQLSMQREVALRILDGRLTRMPGFTERYMQEVRSASSIHHANVVASYEVGQVDGLVYQAMELVGSRTLTHIRTLHPQGLAVAHALALAVEVTRGLEGIHRGGLMHGDLRLCNVFVNDDDVVKLADFGLVRSLEVLRGPDESSAELACLAPEQFATQAQSDIRSDLYAVGAILCVLMTGRQPFQGRSRRELERAIRQDAQPDPRIFVPDVSDDLATVVMKAMARDPVRRYATPAQLREDLERVQYDFVPIHAMPLMAGATVSQASEIRDVPTHQDVKAPTRTLAKDAGFLLLPRAQEPQRDWRLPIAAVVSGVVVLAGIGWWLALGNRSSVVAVRSLDDSRVASVQPGAALDAGLRPSWATAGGTDQHGRWADLTVRGVTFRLRFIPAGTFVIGSLDTDPAHRPDEKAVTVTLARNWWLADSETTQAQYRAITGHEPSGFRGDSLPVENVTWHDCVGFSQRLNALVPGIRARLPTEAEWEYACRAKTDHVSNPSLVVGWFSSPDVTSSRPVKGLPANAWGLHDMLGNVMEWCQDFYGPYPTQPVIDPLGMSGISRVVRGGSWATDPSEGRASLRGKYLPVAHHAHIGFRIAIDD